MALSGTVLSTAGQPIGGAVITVLDGPDAGTRVNTDGSGKYTFASLTVSNANFAASASGYGEDRKGIYVDGTAALNFTLPSAPAPTPALEITASVKLSGGSYQEWLFEAKGTGTFRSYSWEFGDGGTTTGSNPSESHLYLSAGDFTVKLTAVPTSGSPVVVTRTITVSF